MSRKALSRGIVAAAGLLFAFALLGGSPAAGAGTWYVPMEEQVPGGFDHIQILMGYPYEFDSPVMSAFCGPSPVGEDWSQTFLNDKHNFATADGPNTGDDAIHFSIWVGGDPQVDHPVFHFQAYRDGVRVDNADIYCLGPGELDWMVAFGTWGQTTPIPPFPPGDTDDDCDVDLDDLFAVRNNFGMSTGATRAQGDVAPYPDGDGAVDLDDLFMIRNNFGAGLAAAVPEPATLSLLCVGALALLRRRRFARRSGHREGGRRQPA